MTLRLIGAGLPRTGTTSLREALGYLLDAPIYHMSEAFAHPEHASTWVAAMRGRPPVWDDFLVGYAAGVDTPFSTCWRDLAAAYPDAPVLLSHRGSAEVWLRSMEATVLARTREMLATDDSDDPMVPLFRAMFHDVFSDLEDRADLMAGYERRLAQVRAEIGPERLVEWKPGDGWEPLCQALGVPVPDRPFPHENTTEDFLARAEARNLALETDRLVLRRWRVAEAVVQRELWLERDPRVPPHRRIDANGRPALKDFEEAIRTGRPLSTGLLAIERKAGGDVIGYCGLIASDQGGEEEPELAFELLRRVWGQGYATEASLAVLEWARASGYPRLWATVREWNAASRRVLSKVGFTEVSREDDATYGTNLSTTRDL